MAGLELQEDSHCNRAHLLRYLFDEQCSSDLL